MPSRPSRSPPSPTPASVLALPARGWRSLSALRDLAFGLALIVGLSYLPGSITRDWSAPAQRALAIAHDIRSLLHDLVWDSAPGAGERPATWHTGPEHRPVTEPARPPAFPAAPAGLPHVAASFSAAKGMLYRQVYGDHRLCFDCGCAFDQDHRTELGSCGLSALSDTKRAQRIEIDHVFPAAQFGQSRPCWREPTAYTQCTTGGGRRLSGRECCERVDPTFAAAHNDLNNLVPAVGAINGQRSDYNWGMVSGGEQFGDCAIRVDADTRRVQPPAAVRGDIARIMFYMRDTYGFNLSHQDEQLYAAWNNADPPDAWEIERDQRISQIQGRGNRYVEDYHGGPRP